MSYAVRVKTAPTDYPVDLEMVKSHLRVDSDAEDPTLLLYLRAAIDECEAGTSRALMTQQLTLVLDTFPGQADRLYSLETPGAGNTPIILPASPVVSVDAIRYVDVNSDGVTFTVWNAANYLVDKDSEPARVTPLYPLVYPITFPRMNAVEVDFTCGYVDRDSVPPRCKEIILLLCGHWYENREATSELRLAPIPQGIESLIWSERVHHTDDLVRE